MSLAYRSRTGADRNPLLLPFSSQIVQLPVELLGEKLQKESHGGAKKPNYFLLGPI